MLESSKKNILVIGGGYGGISLIDKLKKYDNLQITLIEKSPNHLLQTHIHKYISGYYEKEDITFDLKEYSNKNDIEFVCDEVFSINAEKKYLLTREGHLFHYDYLVIATGANSFFPRQIKNILTYTRDIKNIDNLDYYRSQFNKLIYSKPINKSIVVVGGGVSGVQIACELASKIKKQGMNKENIKVTLVEGMPSILPGLDNFLIRKAQDRCVELDIEVITNLFASEIFNDKLILSNNQEISYDMLLFVIGTIGNLIENVPEKISINPKKQFKVDKYYNVDSYKNIFAIGDISEAEDIKTRKAQTPTAQSARMQAELVAKNLIRDINDKSPIGNNISNKGIFIDLGGTNNVVGRLYNFNLSGKIALFLKKLIYSLHSIKFN